MNAEQTCDVCGKPVRFSPLVEGLPKMSTVSDCRHQVRLGGAVNAADVKRYAMYTFKHEDFGDSALIGASVSEIGDWVLHADHAAALSASEERERKLREAEAEVARLRDALEWRPITRKNMPKAGDEIRRFGGPYPNDVTEVAAECGEYVDLKTYLRYGWTHFRPINPPALEGGTNG